MNRTKTLLALIIIAITGSFVTFYTSNLILSDVSNMFYGVHDVNFISSLPGFIFAIYFTLATLLTARLFYKKDESISLYKKYFVASSILSIFGIITSILTATIIYKSIFAIYPFPGYTIICLIIHIAILAMSIIGLTKVSKETYIKKKKNHRKGYTLNTIFALLFIFIAYNRFGALLWSFSYLQASTFYMTFPFYLSLLLPIGILCHIAFYILRYDEKLKNKNIGIITITSIFVANIVLGIVIILIGINNTEFISAVSPALAIERLLSKPVDTIVMHLLILIFSIYLLIFSLNSKKNISNYFHQ